MDKTQTSKLIKVLIGIVLLAGIIFVASNYYKNITNFAKPIGTVITEGNYKLQSNINTFMEVKGREYALGKENYYCSNALYGYDDKYAYALVDCSGFVMNDHNEFSVGTAFNVPVRFEYSQPYFQITASQQPEDGGGYTTTLRQLFPKFFYDMTRSTDLERTKLDQELKRKAEGVIKIKEKFPELKDYPSEKLPPRSIQIETDQSNLYIAFIQNGSGLPIIGAKCFLIKPDESIVESGKFTADSGYFASSFSAKECQ